MINLFEIIITYINFALEKFIFDFEDYNLLPIIELNILH